MTTAVIIPARWGSTRLPGKPLIDIAGHTLLERCIDLGRRATRGMAEMRLIVATDDERIAAHAEQLGCEYVLTDAQLSSGSARALAAANTLPLAPAHIVNLQGDAPFVEPETVRRIIEDVRFAAADCTTPVVRLTWRELDELRALKAVSPFSGTCCIRAADGRALWFSKAIVPAIRDEEMLRRKDAFSPVFRHVGLYGYLYEALRRFHAAPPAPYEQLEGLEQLRLLEMGMSIQTVVIPSPRIAMSGIDTMHDVALAERMIAQHGDPFGR